MNFQTCVDCKKTDINITHNSNILLIGSCFTENIGKILKKSKFKCIVNPYGVLYNPLSISRSLNEIIDLRKYNENDVFYYKGLYHSFMHHTTFSSDNLNMCLEHINSQILNAHESLTSLDYIIITLGSSYIYRHNGIVVANCHKLPEKSFERQLCDYNSFIIEYRKLLDKLFSVNGHLRIIFTISPIRHIRDGLHNNMISKSILAIFVYELQKLYSEKIYYFPAYEILNDELRDYRFYADDMVHPSELSILYIWEKFKTMYMDKKTHELIDKCNNIEKMISHKPFNPNSNEYKSFVKSVIDKIVAFTSEYPYLDYSEELKYLKSYIRNSI